MTRTPEPPIPSAQECAAFGMHMPELILRMESELGVEPVRAFLARYGGLAFNIPPGPRTMSSSDAAVALLYRNVGWGRIEVPLGPARQSARRGHAACSLLIEGASLSTATRASGLSGRSVIRYKVRLRRRNLLPLPDKDPAA